MFAENSMREKKSMILKQINYLSIQRSRLLNNNTIRYIQTNKNSLSYGSNLIVQKKIPRQYKVVKFYSKDINH